MLAHIILLITMVFLGSSLYALWSGKFTSALLVGKVCVTLLFFVLIGKIIMGDIS